jgi:vacuolar-type H+-ATPase subunit C/Vma6
MQTSYIYSVSRANALSQSLLNKTDIERLLVANAGEDLQSALKETYLAPYLVQVPDENLALAIEKTLTDAKALIHRIAPQGDIFRVLWIQYDIHNLRVFAKAQANGLTYEDCQPFTSERGVYDSSYLHQNAEAGTLDSLQPGWQQVYKRACEFATAGEIDRIDGVFDELFFTTCSQIVKAANDNFITTYYTTLVDLYNLKTNLRLLHNPTLTYQPRFVAGGKVTADKLETEETILETLTQFGGAEFWRQAIELYQQNGNTTSLDARNVEYMVMLAKEYSYDMFTSASLALYYLKCRQAAANVRTIVVGKNNGMNTETIRTNLRMAHVND